jgi:hypothetical protein
MAQLYKTVHLYPEYREQDAVQNSLKMGAFGLAAGLFSASVKNAYFTTSTSPWTLFTQYGSTIPIYGIHAQLPLY